VSKQPQHGWLENSHQFKIIEKVCFEANYGAGKKFLDFFLKKSMHTKGNWSLKRLQVARRRAESLFSTDIYSNTSSDEGENKEYLFTYYEPISSNKSKLAK
jgi:5-methylcytosine-specific restriction endonuclease McrBC GTP-binding regulatory subunit McrB